jgi:hypothetical protein
MVPMAPFLFFASARAEARQTLQHKEAVGILPGASFRYRVNDCMSLSSYERSSILPRYRKDGLSLNMRIA